jgi:hypothetical protein
MLGGAMRAYESSSRSRWSAARERAVAWALAIFDMLRALLGPKWVRYGVLPALGMTLAWSATSNVEYPVQHASANPADLIGARSPGTRPDGVLTQTKPARQRTAALQQPKAPKKPQERVLANVREHEPPIAGPVPIAFGDPAPQANPLPWSPFHFPGPHYAPNLPPPPTSPDPFRRLSLSATPGAVPEPGTWVMMVVGIGTVGAMARRQRRKSKARLAPVPPETAC